MITPLANTAAAGATYSVHCEIYGCAWVGYGDSGSTVVVGEDRAHFLDTGHKAWHKERDELKVYRESLKRQ